MPEAELTTSAETTEPPRVDGIKAAAPTALPVARPIPTKAGPTPAGAVATGNTKSMLRALFPSRRLILISSFASIISGAASTALLAFINTMLQRRQEDPSFGWIFLGLAALALATGFASQYMVTRLLEYAAADLRVDVNRRILALPLPRIEELGTSRLITVLTGDIFTISIALGPTLTLVWANGAIVLVCVAYLILLSWKLALWIIPFFAIIAALYAATRWGDRYHHAARETLDALMGHYRTVIEGAKELKMHRDRREALMSASFRAVVERLRDNFLAGQAFYLVALNVLSLLSLVAIAALLMAGFRSGLSATVIGGYVLTILYVQGPIRVLGNTLMPLRSAAIAMRKIAAMGLADGGEDLDHASERPRATSCRALAVEEMTFRYQRDADDSTFSVGPIDLELHGGELVFLVGGNGSGKSTLAKVVTGVYPSESGRLRLNGQVIEEADRDWYRQHFSVVFSDFFLFDDLRGANIPALDERIRGYLVKLGLDRKVTVDGGMLSTIALSRGQQRRLALVAALLEDRPICVFDEWAADQDPEFKKFFYTEFLPELRAAGKAVLAITHDDRYFHLADRILKMESGKLVAAPRPARDSEREYA